MSKFGYFDDHRREYVITNPKTPLPWINYLGTDKYFGIISNTAGGYTFYQDARYRRLLRYRYNNIPMDQGGRYIFLKDHQTNEFWGTTWQPTQSEVTLYECRHGLGYTQICVKKNDILTRTKYFIPLDESVEIWRMTISNTEPDNRKPPKKISLFSYVEFCLWDALDDSTNFQRNLNTGEVEIDQETSTIFHKTEYRERRNHFAYFSCSEPMIGFDTDRDAFIGAYGNLSNPMVLQTGESSNSIAHGWSPIGSHHIQIELGPGETKELYFLLGYHENPKDQKFDPPQSQKINKQKVNQIIHKYHKIENIARAFEELKSYWNDILSNMVVETPDEHTNRMVNIWNAYQCMVTFNISRSASFFESGISRGIGFRDSNQDILGFIHLDPQRARERILDLAATQMQNGGAYHQFQPLTKRGNNEIGNNFNDDPLWLVLSVAAYLKETGDFTILTHNIPYESTPGTEQSLIHHLKAAVDYTVHHLGPHKLPLIGRADWNDCLNLNCFSEDPDQSFQTTTNTEGMIAESIFIGALFVLAATELKDILIHINQPDEAALYEKQAQEMQATIMLHGWDGDWFLRAYDATGKKVGSKECLEGQIFIEPQGMCIMAGIGMEEERAQRSLLTVEQRLVTDHGLVLLDPPYQQYYLDRGEISSYPPGYKENGSCFCHTNPWIMIAEAKLGHGDKAFQYYHLINPSVREEISEVHLCEPYVYAQTIAGKQAHQPGEAKNSWLTGAAAWNYVAISQWILGIRPTYQGLCINPQLPSTWKGCTVIRKFQNKTYRISISRTKDNEDLGIWINKRKIKGDVVPLNLPLAVPQEVCEVEVFISH